MDDNRFRTLMDGGHAVRQKEVAMPRYSYRCTSCDHEYDQREGFGAPSEVECPACSGLARRKFHAVPIIYRGSGFYTTDYARKK